MAKKNKGNQNKVKTYYLDTNIILQQPNSLLGFEDNNVVITSTVLQELDAKKTAPGELGFCAREAVRIIEGLRAEEDGDYFKGLKTPGGGRLMLEPDDTNENYLPASYPLTKPDNRIINSVLARTDIYGDPAILVTSDLLMRIQAVLCGIPEERVQGYRNEEAILKDVYTGKRECFMKGSQFNILFKSKEIVSPEPQGTFVENEFLLVHNSDNPKCTALAQYREGQVKLIPSELHPFNIKARNVSQKFALAALMAPASEIPLVILKGSAGCVDADTEYFNGKEWKPISDYTEGEKVLQYEPSTNTATLVAPLAYINEPCDMMYHFETKYGLDQTLSPEHRVLYWHKKKEHMLPDMAYYHECTAEDVYQRQVHGNGFQNYFNTSFFYDGPGIELSDVEIEVMMMVICDGTFNKNNPSSHRCTLNLKRSRKIKEAEATLKRAKLKYRKTIMGNGYTRFMFNAPRREKSFSSYWYNCSNAQLQVICDNVLKWDGSTKSGRKSFSSSVKETADFVQFAFSACGYRAYSRYDSVQIGEVNTINGKQYIRGNGLWVVTISPRILITMTFDRRGNHTNTPVTKVTPKGKRKYCFSVPSTYLVLRRNGKIFITGNCAKTFLSLAAGLDSVMDSHQGYQKVMITRNNVLSDADLGYLPGSLEDKMGPLVAPFYDNCEALIRSGSKHESPEEIKLEVEDLFASGVIEIAAMAYMRGRSLYNTYLIVDEAQNATPAQILEVVSRAGEGCKVVIAGDPDQIDNPKLDKRSCGISFVAERMLGSKLCCQCTFDPEDSIRSPLALEASVRLTKHYHEVSDPNN